MRTVCLVIALGVIVVTGSAAGVSAIVIPGDTVSGDLGIGDVDYVRFWVPGPCSLSAKVKADKGFLVEVALFSPTGAAVPLGAALKGSPGSRPSIRKATLTESGLYELRISQSQGTGDYRLQVKLGKPATASVDIRAAGVDRVQMKLDGAAIDFEPAGTELTATDVQAAIAELAAKVNQMAEEIDGDETEVLSVYDALDGPQSMEPVFNPPTAEIMENFYLVSDAEVLSASFEAGEVPRMLRLSVVLQHTVTYVPGMERYAPNFGEAAWLEIDGKQHLAQHPMLTWESPVGGPPTTYFGPMGIEDDCDPPKACFDEELHWFPNSRLYTLVYYPTASERAGALTVQVKVGAVVEWDTETLSSGYDFSVLGATLSGR